MAGRRHTARNHARQGSKFCSRKAPYRFSGRTSRRLRVHRSRQRRRWRWHWRWRWWWHCSRTPCASVSPGSDGELSSTTPPWVPLPSARASLLAARGRPTATTTTATATTTITTTTTPICRQGNPRQILRPSLSTLSLPLWLFPPPLPPLRRMQRRRRCRRRQSSTTPPPRAVPPRPWPLPPSPATQGRKPRRTCARPGRRAQLLPQRRCRRTALGGGAVTSPSSCDDDDDDLADFDDRRGHRFRSCSCRRLHLCIGGATTVHWPIGAGGRRRCTSCSSRPP